MWNLLVSTGEHFLLGGACQVPSLHLRPSADQSLTDLFVFYSVMHSFCNYIVPFQHRPRVSESLLGCGEEGKGEGALLVTHRIWT